MFTLPALSTLSDVVANVSTADWVDIGCAAAVVISVWVNAHRGLSASQPVSIGWVCGGLVGWYAYAPAGTFFKGLAFFQEHPEYATAAAVVAVVLLAGGAVKLVHLGLSHLGRRVANQPIDHALGIVTGLLRALLLLLIVSIGMLLAPWPEGHEVFCHETRVGRCFTPLAAEILSEAKGTFPDIELHRAADPGEAIVQLFRGDNRGTNAFRHADPPGGATGR